MARLFLQAIWTLGQIIFPAAPNSLGQPLELAHSSRPSSEPCARPSVWPRRFRSCRFPPPSSIRGRVVRDRGEDGGQVRPRQIHRFHSKAKVESQKLMACGQAPPRNHPRIRLHSTALRAASYPQDVRVMPGDNSPALHGPPRGHTLKIYAEMVTAAAARRRPSRRHDSRCRGGEFHRPTALPRQRIAGTRSRFAGYQDDSPYRPLRLLRVRRRARRPMGICSGASGWLLRFGLFPPRPLPAYGACGRIGAKPP